MNKIKVGDYIAGFDLEADRREREVRGLGFSRNFNTLKGLVTRVGSGPCNHYFIEVTSLMGVLKREMEFRPPLDKRYLPYEFTRLGGLDEFKKDFIKWHNSPDFCWIEGVDLNYVRTESGIFTLRGLKNSIKTPIPPQAEPELPRVFWKEAPLPLVRI